MAFCRNCGNELGEGVQFCANCGTPVEAQAQPTQQTQEPQEAQQTQQTQAEQIPAEQVTVAPAADDVSANKGIAWLAYMGLLLLIPMLAKKDSKYCEYHVRQGVTLCATAIAYCIVANILLAIIGAIFPGHITYGYFYSYYANSGVYTLFSVIFSLGYIFLGVIAIIGIVNAATGKEKKLPVFGSVKIFDKLMDKYYG